MHWYLVFCTKIQVICPYLLDIVWKLSLEIVRHQRLEYMRNGILLHKDECRLYCVWWVVSLPSNSLMKSTLTEYLLFHYGKENIKSCVIDVKLISVWYCKSWYIGSISCLYNKRNSYVEFVILHQTLTDRFH